MNDKEFNAVRRQVDGLVKKWVRPIGLGWWNVAVAYEREPWAGATQVNGDECAMDVNVDWRYMRARVRINVKACTDTPLDKLEFYFVHELCHIFVRELRPSLDRESEIQRTIGDEQLEHEERVCTQLALAFIGAREAGESAAKKKAKKR